MFALLHVNHFDESSCAFTNYGILIMRRMKMQELVQNTATSMHSREKSLMFVIAIADGVLTNRFIVRFRD